MIGPPPRVFLSHASEDKPQIREIRRWLRSVGLGSWIDEIELRPGDRLWERIEDGILASDFVLVFLSPASIESEWVQKEAQRAVDEEVANPSDRPRLIPCRLGELQLPEEWRKRLYADFAGGVARGVGRVMSAVASSNPILCKPDARDWLELEDEPEVFIDVLRNGHPGELCVLADISELRAELAQTAEWGHRLARGQSGQVRNYLDMCLPFVDRSIYTLDNLSFGLTETARVALDILGGEAGTPRSVREVVARAHFHVMYAALRSLRAPHQLGVALRNEPPLSPRTLSHLERVPIWEAEAYTNVTPPPVIEHRLAGCDPSQLLALHMIPAQPGFPPRVVIPESALLSDTLSSLKSLVASVVPDAEIPDWPWCQSFVPSLVASYLLDASRRGVLLAEEKGELPLRRTDFSRMGLP